ncbi:heterokaryon incompatibility protein-domain-containing protein [Colletotrichum godetiae]|uniref:Heterokaryon incompatibility protein-domain-containing protein n=1 Tax=Colletotrichum godetiae TaxID=1209918 RepID=A0AAJ0AL20_9PEZI|nr:heterokaryon incompatibility protein-domain-containing protein [Colletotrichum godetiae]KAK1673651.1 heterokaryon incompatibility protein-domain-containing protein [Colletotrichum godetiae]
MGTQSHGNPWSHICEHCLSIFSEARDVSPYGLWSPKQQDGYRLPHTKGNLENGKRDGCRLCCLIWFRRLKFGEKSEIPWPDWYELKPDDDLELRYGFASGTSGYKIHMGIWRWAEGNDNKVYSFFCNIEETTDEFVASIPKEKSLLACNTNTGSDQAFSLAQKFLSDCLASHDCSMPNNNGWAPTRLIDLGQSPSDVAKVVTSASLPRPVRWMTLSHCWGFKPPCVLLDSNITQYMREIPHSELSRTFSDAFIIAKKLGVRYLWIDSICIIQRSEEDWRREAPTMGKVYSLSHCTISASHATDGSGGCFSDRDPWTVLPCVIPSPFSTDPKAPPFLLHGEDLQERWKTDISQAPLHKRAWVFQERLLSPRTLYFGQQQILWGCGQHELCESFPGGVPSQPASIWWQFIGDRRSFRNMLLASAGTKPFERLWSETVKEYSKTQLTFPSDRQVAFSGLPGQLKEERGTQQAYGVWIDESLPWSLLWGTEKKVQARPTNYLAPSWSWMTLNTSVTFGNWYPHGTGLVKAVGLTTSGFGGTNRIGKAENDGLVLEGVLKMAFYRKDVASEGNISHMISQLNGREEESFQLPLSNSAEDWQALGSILRPISSDLETEWTQMYAWDSPEETPRGDIVICLPLVNHTDRVLRFEGLFLEPVPHPPNTNTILSTNESEGDGLLHKFRRIGNYHLMHRANWVASTEKLRFMLI